MSFESDIENGKADPREQTPAGPAKTGLDLKALKTGGIIKQRQKDLFTVRLKCPGGRVPLERLSKIREVAQRYGRGYVHISVRQSIEIPYIRSGDLEKVREELGQAGQEIASAGARVRVPVACGGCEYNPKGLMDTQAAAQEVSRRFFGAGPFGHKFKMAFAGCPMDCVHSSLNDLGFQGAVMPAWEQSKCKACGLCAKACQEGAIVEEKETRRPRYLAERCVHCGDCIRACPFDAWRARETGWIVRAGGKYGRHPICGSTIAMFLPAEKAPEVIEAVISWYERMGKGKGRVRLGALLLEKELWKTFLSDMAGVLGEWAVRKAPAPQPIEAHHYHRAHETLV